MDREIGVDGKRCYCDHMSICLGEISNTSRQSMLEVPPYYLSMKQNGSPLIRNNRYSSSCQW